MKKIAFNFRNNKYISYLVLYSVVSILLLTYLNFSFVREGKGFGWSIDSLPVQLPMFEYLRKCVRALADSLTDGRFPALYDYSVGMGGDALTFLSVWYLEPISFIGVLAPPHKIEAFYDLLVLLRIYLIGLSFGVLCLYEKKENTVVTVIGSLVYAFSGWVYFHIRHPVFYAGLIYLPILIVAAKEVLKKKRGVLFVLIVAISAWTHYYYLYVNTILLFFFLAIDILVRKVNTIKEIFIQVYSIIWRYCLGISIAMVVFLPNIIAFFNSNRTAPHLETGSFYLFEQGWLLRVFTGLISPFFSAGHWLHNGFISFALISYLLVILYKRNAKMIIWGILVAIGFTIPAVTYIFSGFSAIQFRWNYAVGILFAYAIVEYWTEQKLVRRSAVLLLLLLVVYILIPVIYTEMGHEYLNIATVFLGLYIVLIVSYAGRKTNTLFYTLLLSIVSVNIIFDINYTFMPEHGNYIEEFVPRGKSVEIITDEPEAMSYAIEDDSFYRINSARLKVENENSSVFMNNRGISFYNNVMDKYIADYYRGVENVNTRLLDTIDHDSRTVLDALSAVKYYLVYEDDAFYVPYGYELIDSEDGVAVYQNKYALPLGYSYTETISYDTYMSLTALEKQEVLLKAAVLEQGTNLKGHQYESSLIYDDLLTFDFYGCEYDPQSGICRVTEPGGYFSIGYKQREDVETYLRLGGLDIDDYYDAYWKIRIYNNSVDKEVELRSASATYSYGNYNYLINLGYNNQEDEINIAFPFVSEINLRSVEIIHQPMNDYPVDCINRKKNVLENIYVGVNEIEGDFRAAQDELCVISIPYSSGWTAYVDGEKQEILKTNVMFMGLLLEPGNHHIELKYCTPGLKIGALISMCGVIVLIGYILCYRKRGYTIH